MIPALYALVFFTGTVNLVVAALVYTVFRGESDRSARLWVAGSLLIAAGMVMLTVRGYFPDIISYGVINFIMLYAMVLYCNSYFYLTNDQFRPSRIPLVACLLYGLLQFLLVKVGYREYLSLVASIAWAFTHVWIFVSLRRLRSQIQNIYFNVFLWLILLGAAVWLFRVGMVLVFDIALSSDTRLVNVYSLIGAHIVLVAQEITYLAVRLVDEKNKKTRIAELSSSLEKAWAEKQAMADAQGQQREQLLHDMHDGFGSKLATMRHLVGQRQLGMEELADYLEEVIGDLHLVVDTLEHGDSTLQEAIADMRYRIERRYLGSTPTLHWETKLAGLGRQDSHVILHIMRILQEGLNNALRHARAQNVWLSAVYDEPTRQLFVTIRDDGQGIQQPSGRGQGSNSMRVRARELGGQFEMRNANPGVEVALVMPVPVTGTDSSAAA